MMSMDTFKKCLDKVPSYVEVHFSGMCEPWLNPDCSQMVAYACAKGYPVAIFTTLVGMKPEDIDQLDSLVLKSFAVHLPSEQGCEKIAVDETYMQVMKKLLASHIPAAYHCHSQSLHPALKELLADRVSYASLVTRAGNIEIPHEAKPVKKKGHIRCQRNLRHNILLPNGDVILCCMDWAMKHVLGNLLMVDYAALFRSQEFKRLKQGLRDDSLDILCRYCNNAEAVNIKERLRYYTDMRRYWDAFLRLIKQLSH